MNVVQAWLLLFVCAWADTAALAQGVISHASRVDYSGRRYVRLGEWARENNFDGRWDKGNDALLLSNRFARLVLRKDSREAEVNGVNVCLSFPFIWRDGTGYIAEMDLDTAIDPVLFPPKNGKGMKIRNIVIDPGHGGKDPGNQLGGHQEKKYTLLLAQEVAKQLTRAGFKTSLTRTSDTFIELPVRPDIAKRRGADLFISLHWNELPGNSEIKGSQTFCMTPAGASSSNAGGEMIGGSRKLGNLNDRKNMLLAYELQHSLLQYLNVEDRGVRRARYWVLRDAVMPAVLIEGGFMSNASEAQRIYDAGYREHMAQAIVAGVLAYKGKVEQPDAPSRPAVNGK